MTQAAERIPAALCIGFRPRAEHGGPERSRTLSLVADSMTGWFQGSWITPDGRAGGQPFNRSEAKNRAAEEAMTAGADILVFADADTYAPYHQIMLAVGGVQQGADISFAHNGTCLYLATGVVRGNGQGGIVGPFPGGIFAISADAFKRLGGWDEEFVGWGHEDLCLLMAADKIFGMKTVMSNHPLVGPVFKLDILHSRLGHEDRLRMEPDSEEGRLYAANSARRDAYLALERGDEKGYWALREKEAQ